MSMVAVVAVKRRDKKVAEQHKKHHQTQEDQEHHQKHLEVKELVQKAMEHNSRVLKAKNQPQTEVWVTETKEVKPKARRKPRRNRKKKPAANQI